jgi:hypothetical protein
MPQEHTFWRLLSRCLLVLSTDIVVHLPHTLIAPVEMLSLKAWNVETESVAISFFKQMMEQIA